MQHLGLVKYFCTAHKIDLVDISCHNLEIPSLKYLPIHFSDKAAAHSILFPVCTTQSANWMHMVQVSSKEESKIVHFDLLNLSFRILKENSLKILRQIHSDYSKHLQ